MLEVTPKEDDNMTEFATLQDFLTQTEHGPYVSIYLVNSRTKRLRQSA